MHPLSQTPLQQDLASKVIPLLSLHEMAATACAGKLLRDVAYERDDVWISAATAFLPPQHPPLTGLLKYLPKSCPHALLGFSQH